MFGDCLQLAISKTLFGECAIALPGWGRLPTNDLHLSITSLRFLGSPPYSVLIHPKNSSTSPLQPPPLPCCSPDLFTDVITLPISLSVALSLSLSPSTFGPGRERLT
ncbi:hypothetical protein J6590_020793 [Homalodisca vitripennis]|nr:hypothetical protein J6590_020793 [Homalodisca vitripennis]